MAARGANVCRVHGGSAPQVKAAARRRRLDQAADVLVQRLFRFALDGDPSDNVALQAIIAALDRAGLSVKSAVELSVPELAPLEELLRGVAFDGVARITRAEHCVRYGLLPADKPATAPFLPRLSLRSWTPGACPMMRPRYEALAAVETMRRTRTRPTYPPTNRYPIQRR
jgi:hypothetical protein